MARPRKTLGDSKAAIVNEEILKENPAGLPDETGIVIATHIPEMRRVIFLNGRDPGVALMFHYHSASHPLKQYTLFHGHEVDLPVEVIEHLETCNEPEYGYRNGPEGHPEMFVKSRKFIFTFRTPHKGHGMRAA